MMNKKAASLGIIILLIMGVMTGCGETPEEIIPSPTPTPTTPTATPTPTLTPTTTPEPTPEPINLEDLVLQDNELGGTVSAMLTGNPIISLPDGTFIIGKDMRIDASGNTIKTYNRPIVAVAGDRLIGMYFVFPTVTLYEFDFDGSNEQTVLSFDANTDPGAGSLFSAAVYEDYLFLLIGEDSISRNKTGDTRSIWQDLTALYRVSLIDKTVVRVEQPDEAVDYRVIFNDRIYMTVLTEPYTQNISSTDLNGEDLRIEYGLDQLVKLLEKSGLPFAAELPCSPSFDELKDFLEINGVGIYDLPFFKAYRKIDLIHVEEVNGETVIWFLGYIPNDFDIVRLTLSTAESTILTSFKQSNITVTHLAFDSWRPCYSDGYIYYVAPWDGAAAHTVYKMDILTGNTTRIYSFGDGDVREYAYRVFVSDGNMLIYTVKDNDGSGTVHQYFKPDGGELLEVTQK